MPFGLSSSLRLQGSDSRGLKTYHWGIEGLTSQILMLLLFLMRKLSAVQRKLLSEFCLNLGVAWLAAGIVAPLVSEKVFIEAVKPGVLAEE